MTVSQVSTEVVPIVDYRPPPTALQSWALEADAAYLLAERMVQTSFCPKQFQGNAVEAAAAVLAGAEVGLSPLAALRSFDIIQGVAAPRALTLRAIAQSIGCQFQTLHEDDVRVQMRARRPGGEWETVEWTIAQAQALGLATKDNWKKQPRAMLVARATAELARRVAADRILGLGYAAEEQDGEDAPAAKPKRATVQRKTAPAPEAPELPPPDPAPARQERGNDRTLRSVSDVDLPPLPDEPAPAPGEERQGQADPVPSSPPTAAAPGDRPGYATAAQLRMLRAMENTAGVTDREERLRRYTEMAGRQITTSKDLTRIECQRILDRYVALEQASDGAPDEDVQDAEVVDDGLFPEAER